MKNRFPVLLGISFCILFACCIMLFFSLFSIKETDQEKYSALLKETSHTSTEPYAATQEHHSVLKEIMLTHGQQRLQLKLYSSDAQLILDHQENRTAVIEKMHNVTGYLQEELFYLLPDGREVIAAKEGQFLVRSGGSKASTIPINESLLRPMQIIRYLQAENALYNYQQDHFIAENVQIARYIVPGHKLLESFEGHHPMMTGVANSVEFSLGGKELNFKAHQFKATLFTAERSEE